MVTAYDLSPEMLAVVENEAIRRDLTTSRHSKARWSIYPLPTPVLTWLSHAFRPIIGAMCPPPSAKYAGYSNPGTLVVIDTISPENPLFDTLLQTVEILADASHIRNYRVSEWRSMLHAAGFDVRESDGWTLPMEFSSWLARKRTPGLRADAIRDVLAKASDVARQYFKVQVDGSFDLGAVWLQTKLSRV